MIYVLRKRSGQSVKSHESGSRKKHLRHTYYVNTRKMFDKRVNRDKRQHWYTVQEGLVHNTDNPKEFWRKIGKIGVGSERRNKIPMEVKLSDASVSNDKNIVLNKWKGILVKC